MTDGITTKAAAPGEAIVDATLELARDIGAAAVTGRLVARQAGISPSAINYQFGGLDGLLRDAHERLAREGEAWRAACLAGLEATPSEMVALSGAAAGIIADLAAHADRRALLIQEFREMAARGEVDLADGPAREWAAGESFWRQLAGQCSQPPDTGDLWMTLATGALSLAFLDLDPVARFAWLSSACERVEDRLAGVTPQLRPAVSEPPAHSAADPDWADGKRRIVEATLRLIGEAGVAQVTHRRVAAAAGLSLASTTYFFRSKNELIAEAFGALYRRTMARSMASPVWTGYLADALLTADGEVRWEAGAMMALYLAAARDPALRGFASALRFRGHGSLRMLQAGGLRDADRLDGLVWSLIVGGMFQRSLLLARSDRRAFLNETAERFFGLLFGGRGGSSDSIV